LRVVIIVISNLEVDFILLNVLYSIKSAAKKNQRRKTQGNASMGNGEKKAATEMYENS